MEKENLLGQLNELLNLDYDAIQGYNRVIDGIENKGIQDQLRIFRGDHERHVREYQDLMREIGGKLEEPNRDLKGIFLEAMAAIQSKMGSHSALKALESAEKVVNSTYRHAVAEDLPLDVMAVVERNYEDERRHLAFVEQALQREAAA
jgi:uncharacterized protein (TIGR02284 family)